MTNVVRLPQSNADPAPPVPADTDARAIPTMPIDVEALLIAGRAQLADAEAFRAALMLRCAAFHHVPAGSLPDDDAILCGLVGLGRDPATWQRVRAKALAGFQRCTDGRLYHRPTAHRALDSLLTASPNLGPQGTAGIAGKLALRGVDSPCQPSSLARPSPRGTPSEQSPDSPNATVSELHPGSRSKDTTTTRGDRGVRGVKSFAKAKVAKNRKGATMGNSPKKIGAALPQGWTPSDSEITYGRHLGLSDSRIQEIAEDMRLWAYANANRAVARKLDWGLTFRGFLRRERDKDRRRAARDEERKGGRGFFRRATDAVKRTITRSDEDGERSDDDGPSGSPG